MMFVNRSGCPAAACTRSRAAPTWSASRTQVPGSPGGTTRVAAGAAPPADDDSPAPAAGEAADGDGATSAAARGPTRPATTHVAPTARAIAAAASTASQAGRVVTDRGPDARSRLTAGGGGAARGRAGHPAG